MIIQKGYKGQWVISPCPKWMWIILNPILSIFGYKLVIARVGLTTNNAEILRK